MIDALIWAVGLIAVATILCEAGVRAVTSFARLKYGSSSRLAVLEGTVAALEKEVKTTNSKDIRERLQACEKVLNLRMF